MLIVVENGTAALLGRNWTHSLNLDWNSLLCVHGVRADMPNNFLLDEFPSVFADGLRTCQGFQANIQLKDGANPKCHSTRTPPYALCEQVDMELDRLLAEGNIVPVECSEWASPIVVIKKKNGSICLHADFKVSINPHIESNIHPIPNASDLPVSIAGATVFCKLDLSQAYAQLQVSEESKKLGVITTHRGLFAYTCQSFGVSSAPSIWQRTIEQVLQGVGGVLVYFNDILIRGCTQAEHDNQLRQDLQRFTNVGSHLR